MRFVLHSSIIWAFLVAFPVVSPAKGDQPLAIAWYSELSPEHSYWKQNYAFAKAAADDLGVALVPHYVESDQIYYRQLLSESTATSAGDSRVDGVVFLNIKHQNDALLDVLEKGGVPAISNVLSMDYEKVGKPRQRYSKWIAEIVDDEQENGYLLALKLFEEARRLRLYAPDGTIHIIAINGKATDSAAIKRAEGLQKALAEQSDVTLHQSFNAANWSRAEGAEFTRVALRRYPHTAIVWSSNDDILLGALNAARELGHEPGVDLLTGGIDGTLDVIRLVAAGDVVCTIGGLSMHSGWAVVLLHDYLHGVDFVDDTGVIVKNRNTMVDRSNAQRYLDKFGDGDWSRVDFRRYSKVRTPRLTRYDFSIEPLMEED